VREKIVEVGTRDTAPRCHAPLALRAPTPGTEMPHAYIMAGTPSQLREPRHGPLALPLRRTGPPAFPIRPNSPRNRPTMVWFIAGPRSPD